MALTDVAIKNAKSHEKSYKMGDAGGLFLLVQPSGGKLWRLKYRVDGREKKLAIGPYPEISLAEARRRRDDARTLIVTGKDPSREKQRDKVRSRAQAESTFAAITKEYCAKRKRDGDKAWAAATATRSEYLLSLLDSSIGRVAIAEIKPPDVLDVSMDQARFTSHDGIVLWDVEGEELERQRANFMVMKPEQHSAVKKVIMPPFMPRALAELAPEVDKLAAEIVDRVAARGTCEFVFDVASVLPVHTFCELMGIPPQYRDQVAGYGNAMADVESRTSVSMDPMIGLFGLAQQMAEEKRRNPDGRLLSVMVNDTTLGLDPMMINQFVLVFAMAGHETTRSTAAHFIHLMNHHPNQYALLRGDFDAYIDNAIDEVLRYTSTTTNFIRHAVADTEIGGQPVRKGDKIYLSYAAANRDPAVFTDPHSFDITRSNAKRHLAFGAGPHICVGARLAKMQLRGLLKQIVTRIPDIHSVGEPEWLRSIWFNAIIRMPVAFTPERLSL